MSIWSVKGRLKSGCQHWGFGQHVYQMFEDLLVSLIPLYRGSEGLLGTFCLSSWQFELWSFGLCLKKVIQGLGYMAEVLHICSILAQESKQLPDISRCLWCSVCQCQYCFQVFGVYQTSLWNNLYFFSLSFTPWCCKAWRTLCNTCTCSSKDLEKQSTSLRFACYN